MAFAGNGCQLAAKIRVELLRRCGILLRRSARGRCDEENQQRGRQSRSESSSHSKISLINGLDVQFEPRDSKRAVVRET
jgi:hypothetical protein